MILAQVNGVLQQYGSDKIVYSGELNVALEKKKLKYANKLVIASRNRVVVFKKSKKLSLETTFHYLAITEIKKGGDGSVFGLFCLLIF